MPDTSQICIIGIGNPDSGDDGAGPAVVDRIKKMSLEGTEVVKVSGETAGLIEVLGNNERVILVDAIEAVTKPGAIHRFDAGNTALPSEMFVKYSTHSMGVDEAVEMARVLGDLPERVVVFGIEGINFEPGDPMSPEVLMQLNELTIRVTREISEINS